MLRKPRVLPLTSRALIGILAVALMAAVPTVAFAKTAFFSADGNLAQSYVGDPVAVIPGVPGVAPVDYLASVAPDAYGVVQSEFVPGTLGISTINQSFNGTIVNSGLSVLKGSDLSIVQNSWFDLAATASGTIDGVAWGTFDLKKGRGNSLSGSYAAKLDGMIVPDYMAGVACPDLSTGASSGGMYISVTDIGDWTVTDARGSFDKVAPGDQQAFTNFFGQQLNGNAMGIASGCLGGEQATFTFLGTYGNGHGNQGDNHGANESGHNGHSSDDSGNQSNRGSDNGNFGNNGFGGGHGSHSGNNYGGSRGSGRGS